MNLIFDLDTRILVYNIDLRYQRTWYQIMDIWQVRYHPKWHPPNIMSDIWADIQAWYLDILDICPTLVRSPSFSSYKFNMLHMWLAYRPNGDTLSLMFSRRGTHHLPQCCLRCFWFHCHRYWVSCEQSLIIFPLSSL